MSASRTHVHFGKHPHGFWIANFVLVWTWSILGWGHLDAATLAPNPIAIPLYQESTWTLAGRELTHIQSAWNNFPGEVSILETSDTSVRIKVRPDKHALSGLAAIVFNDVKTGPLKPLLVFLDKTNAVRFDADTSTENTHSWTTGLIQSREGMTGTLELEKDSPIFLDVWATRMGSPLDAVLTLRAPETRNILWQMDDHPFSGKDPVNHWTPPHSGIYQWSIHDIGYDAGKDYFFLFRISDQPCSDVFFPMGITQSSTVNKKQLGHFRHVSSLEISSNDRDVILSKLDREEVYLPNPRGQHVISFYQEMVETSGNDSPEQADFIQGPCGINGRFEHHRDNDWFRFESSADITWTWKSITRSMGIPCDVMMSVHDSNGKILQQATIEDGTYNSLKWTCQKSGEYYLKAWELTHQFGETMVYRIDMQWEKPWLDLKAKETRLHGAPGARVALPIEVNRDRLDQTMGIEALGLPEDWTINVEQEDKSPKQITCLVTIPSNAKPGTIHAFKLKAGAGDICPPQWVSNQPALKSDWKEMRDPPSQLNDWFWIGVTQE